MAVTQPAPSPSLPVLELRSVALRLGERWLFEDLSFALRPGEFVALLGPNGAGKSSLLSLLSGERSPSRGAVLWEGRELSDLAPLERARRLALLPQESAISFPFTALEVATMGRYPHGGSSEEQRSFALRSLARCGADGLAERLYPTLSGGERQRVQLARVLAQIAEAPRGHGRCLLLDEPTSNLDLAHQHATLRLAKELAEEGVAVLAILHDLNLAASYADRIALLDGGRLCAVGPPEEVLRPAAIRETYGVASSTVAHPWRSRPLIAT